MLFLPWTSFAQQSSDAPIDVYLRESRTISFPGITRATVLDEVAAASTSADTLRLFGLARGETIVFVWVGNERKTVVVRVIERPPDSVSRPTLKHDPEHSGHGFVASTVRTSSPSNVGQPTILTNELDWRQQMGPDSLLIRTQAQNVFAQGQPGMNIISGTVRYGAPSWSFTAFDFLLRLNGGSDKIVTGYSPYNNYLIRGADLVITKGSSEFEAFAGTTQPSYYLTLSGTRAIGGINLTHRFGDRLAFYSTTGVVNSPLNPLLNLQRESTPFQTVGLAAHFPHGWAAQAMGGASTQGGLWQGALSYTGSRFTAFAANTSSAAKFPLNQLQLLYAGGSSITAGGTYRLGLSSSAAVYYQRSSSPPSALFPVSTHADYLNPNLVIGLTQRHQLTLNYAFTQSEYSGTIPTTSTHRGDVLLHSLLARNYSNTAQFSIGRTKDPRQLRDEASYTVQDTLTVPFRSGVLSFGGLYQQTAPSLITQVQAQLQLLSPVLQQLFLLDPTAFVDSANLTPELRALISQMQPSDTELFASAQFHIGKRLNVSPTFRYVHAAQVPTVKTDSTLVGYALTFRLTPTVLLQSSLSNSWVFDPRLVAVTRATTFMFGIRKDLTGQPRLKFFAKTWGQVEGRVCVDGNANGKCDPGEKGFPGLLIEVDGSKTIKTDAQGNFTARVSPGEHRLALPLEQFHSAVRVTNATDVPVEVWANDRVQVAFAVVNSGRVLGTVFNDYTMDGNRQPDALGIPDVHLRLRGNGIDRTVQTDGTGEYEILDLLAGDYEVEIDRATLPANYIVPQTAIRLHVDPLATVIQDVPLRALRSVSGHVMLRAASLDPQAPPNLTPAPHIELRLGNSVTETDASGAFVLRNLPAGDLQVELEAKGPLPEGVQLHPVRVRLPRTPVQVDGATILIPITTSPTAVLAAMPDVLFDFNSCKVKRVQASELRRHAMLINEHADITIVVEGHCDSRGSRKYNMQLGRRRAAAVKQVLVKSGVPAKRVRVVTYGSSKPVCHVQDESCWKQNRRAHIQAIGKPPLAKQAEANKPQPTPLGDPPTAAAKRVADPK